MDDKKINKVIDILIKNSEYGKNGTNTRLYGSEYFKVAIEIVELFTPKK